MEDLIVKSIMAVTSRIAGYRYIEKVESISDYALKHPLKLGMIHFLMEKIRCGVIR